MYTFIVLGLIPGTDIQITFIGWLLAAALLAIAMLVYTLAIRNFFVEVRVVYALFTMTLRPLPAVSTRHRAATLL